MDYNKQVFFEGGYLFLQSIYYQLRLDRVCRKIRDKHSFRYDLNAILSDLIYTRILEPSSKRSSYEVAMGKTKSTVPIQSSKWDYLRMGTGVYRNTVHQEAKGRGTGMSPGQVWF